MDQFEGHIKRQTVLDIEKIYKQGHKLVTTK